LQQEKYMIEEEASQQTQPYE
jgi:hypothetical protein